ncbi:MAG: DUF4142 domain-containing protein [Chryseolinea sp.]
MKINKKFVLLTACVIIMGLLFNTDFAKAQEKDPVKKANIANEEKAKIYKVDEDIADFLVKSADARMMDSKEGKLAIEKGTTASIRKYGQLMVKDQAEMLEKIKRLALKHQITLPTGISDKKEDGREDLAEKTGDDFDKKFIKMMIKDHERDVKLFKNALDYKDEAVKLFANEYLPMIQSHLDKINEIKTASN